jgi:hypothetical protein
MVNIIHTEPPKDWDTKLTLQGNAEKLKISYGVAAYLVRIFRLDFVRLHKKYRKPVPPPKPRINFGWDYEGAVL